MDSLVVPPFHHRGDGRRPYRLHCRVRLLGYHCRTPHGRLLIPDDRSALKLSYDLLLQLRF